MTINQSITVLFLCYNDQATIGPLIETAKKVLSKVAKDWEIIVIDDKSSDQSRKVLINLKHRYSRLKLIFNSRNLGYGGTLSKGLKACQKELIFYTDGDGQYDIGEIKKMLSVFDDQCDLVNGYKIKRKDPIIRRIIGKLYQILARVIFQLPISDPNCDFRLIRKKILEKIDFKSKSGGIGVELVKKIQLAGGKFKEVGVHHYSRRAGQSQFFKLRNIIATWRDLTSLYRELK